MTSLPHKPEIIEAEIVELTDDDVLLPGDQGLDRSNNEQITAVAPRVAAPYVVASTQRVAFTYVLLPVIFLTVTLLGGLRLAAADNAFLFLKPALIALVLAAGTVALYLRSGLISVSGWLDESLPIVQNVAGFAVLLTLFTATVQLFNSLLPEQGLPFWVVGFCFVWIIWNNLFADFDTKRLLRSLIALFGFAFAVKYLLLANVAAPEGGNWLSRLIENPGREAATWLLDLPRYSAGTGYIQFFTVTLYLLGLFLTPRSTQSVTMTK